MAARPRIIYTLSGGIGKVVASHLLRLHVRVLLRLQLFILCTWRSGGTAHEGGGCDQSIGSTVSVAIVRSWLWLNATIGVPHWAIGLLHYITASSC